MKKIENGIWVFLAIVVGVAVVVIGYWAVKGWSVSPVIAGSLVVVWLAAVGSYLVWAVYRYNVNFGLTDHEWAVLYPELYASEQDLPRYQLLHRQFLESRTHDATHPGVKLPPFEPPSNPYGAESFGLPPGTIRGLMALTALVLFSAMELVNVFKETGWETQFHELITAFMMVLAFYFGSRAVEVMKDRNATRPKGVATRKDEAEGAGEEEAAAPAAGADAAAEGTKPPSPEVDAPSRQPALPAHLQDDRAASLVTLASLGTAAARAAVPAGGLSASDPLGKRVLALTAAFETGFGFPACFSAVAPSFDRMGLSFGALQWNLGMGTLQPLWQRMLAEHEASCRTVLGARFDDFRKLFDLATRAEQVAWAEERQKLESRSGKPVRVLDPGWRDALFALGQTPEMIALQVEAAAARYRAALGWCREWDLVTERAVALMFDINVQNGKLDRGNARFRIEQDIGRLPALPPLDAELEKLSIVATRRSEIVDPRWRQDVLARKLTIARGEGVVHGRRFDLLREFCIGLRPAEPTSFAPTATAIAVAAGPAPGAPPAPAAHAGYPGLFPREAMITSDTALRLHLDNEPDPASERCLQRLCNEFLVPIATRFPGVRVTSGYRSPAVNKAVGGSPTSAHQFGRAADLVAPAGTALETVVAWLRDDSGLAFDQVILEFGRWVHVGIAEDGNPGRGEVLTTIQPGKYTAFPAKVTV